MSHTHPNQAKPRSDPQGEPYVRERIMAHPEGTMATAPTVAGHRRDQRPAPATAAGNAHDASYMADQIRAEAPDADQRHPPALNEPPMGPTRPPLEQRQQPVAQLTPADDRADASADELAYAAATTRQRLDARIERLAFELKPQSLVRRTLGGSSVATNQDIKDRFTASAKTTLHQQKEDMLRKIKKNPIGLSLLATGLAWILFSKDDRKLIGRGHEARDRRSQGGTTAAGGYYAYGGPRYAGVSTADEARTSVPTQFDGQQGHAAQADTDQPGQAMNPGQAAAYGTTPRYTRSGHSRTGLHLRDKLKNRAASRTRTGRHLRDQLFTRASAAKSTIKQAANELATGTTAAGTRVRETGSHVAHRTSEHASQLAGRISDAASAATETVGSAATHTAQAAREGVSHSAHTVGDATAATGRWVKETSRERPVAVAIGAIAAGLLIGSLIPASRKENEWFGEYSDETREALQRKAEAAKRAATSTLQERGQDTNLTERAGAVVGAAVEAAKGTVMETANQVTEEVKSAAGEVLEEAKSAAIEEAHEQKLHPEDVTEDVKAAATEAADSAKQA